MKEFSFQTDFQNISRGYTSASPSLPRKGERTRAAMEQPVVADVDRRRYFHDPLWMLAAIAICIKKSREGASQLTALHEPLFIQLGMDAHP